MTDESNNPQIKVTDRRHFDKTGEKRSDAEVASDPVAEGGGRGASSRAGGSKGEKRPEAPPSGTAAQSTERTSGPPSEKDPGAADKGQESPRHVDLSAMAPGISSSFSLLVARLAQETEIYLGLVPYPGKETAEPDLEAARAMIDLLSMLQEKTRGNLDAEESRLLESLLYTYRLEFVRLRSGGGAR
jgi:hypothetical protein